MFVAKCVQPGRVFISRLLEQLRKLGASHHRFRLSREFRKDLIWWQTFIKQFNGVSIILEELWACPDGLLSTDACPTGCGAICGREYLHSPFPTSILCQNLHINALELLGVVLTIRIWGPTLKGKRAQIYCDNVAAVAVINSGRSKDSFMLKCLREICFLCAKCECVVRAVHLAGIDNRVADSLSRWHLSDAFRESFRRMIGDNVTEITLTGNPFEFSHDL